MFDFQAAVRRGLDTITELVGVAVVYRVAATGDELALTAIASPVDPSAELAQGFERREDLAVWRLRAEDLVADGLPHEPVAGDRIVRELNGKRLTYEVTPLSPGQRPFNPVGSYGHGYRVYTRLVDCEPL